jgi:hypothetical protein
LNPFLFFLLSANLAKNLNISLDNRWNRCNSGVMPRGRQSRSLSRSQIRRLEEFRRASHEGAPHGYSLPQLRSAMAAGFGWRTLQKALQGRPVWDLHHSYIAQWIERFLPAAPLPRDGKAAASGAGREMDEETAPEGNVRGRSVDQAAGAETEEAQRSGEPDTKESGTTRTVRGSR